MPWLTLLIPLTLFLVCTELSAWATFGWYIPEDDLNWYFQKYLLTYKENGCDKGIIYGLTIPYIGTGVFNISSRWYIATYGRIPRWSKWHGRLNELYNEGYKPKKKSLTDPCRFML